MQPLPNEPIFVLKITAPTIQASGYLKGHKWLNFILIHQGKVIPLSQSSSLFKILLALRCAKLREGGVR